MREVFVGSDALASGGITRARLRWNYQAIFPGVYLHKQAVPSLRERTVAAWLWSGRNGLIAGRAAAAMHGALWVDANTPIEMIWRCGRPPRGIEVRNERIEAVDIAEIDGVPATTPERTAFDIARHLPRNLAVAHLDALARATGIEASRVILLADRYPRARGLPRARIALSLMDGGAQSPQETRLRLVLIDDGLPSPRTQIMVAEHSRRFLLHRAYSAFARRGWTPPKLR
jgi:alkylation response protein AidB-like acyl-CoA dehydrogenase